MVTAKHAQLMKVSVTATAVTMEPTVAWVTSGSASKAPPTVSSPCVLMVTKLVTRLLTIAGPHQPVVLTQEKVHSSKRSSKDDIVEVGVIPAGKSNIKIQLTADMDIDIQLYDGSTKLVAWSADGNHGMLSGAARQVLDYQGIKDCLERLQRNRRSEGQ